MLLDQHREAITPLGTIRLCGIWLDPTGLAQAPDWRSLPTLRPSIAWSRRLPRVVGPGRSISTCCWGAWPLCSSCRFSSPDGRLATQADAFLRQRRPWAGPCNQSHLPRPGSDTPAVAGAGVLRVSGPFTIQHKVPPGPSLTGRFPFPPGLPPSIKILLRKYPIPLRGRLVVTCMARQLLR